MNDVTFVYHKPFVITDTLPPLENDLPSVVLLVGETSGWIYRMLDHARKNDLKVCTASSNPLRYVVDVSSVTLDREKDMELIVHYFHHAGRSKIALWGINPSSPADHKRLSGYLKATRDLGLPPS